MKPLYLKNSQLRFRIEMQTLNFYLLSKIHKPDKPERPVISSVVIQSFVIYWLLLIAWDKETQIVR